MKCQLGTRLLSGSHGSLLIHLIVDRRRPGRSLRGKQLNVSHDLGNSSLRKLLWICRVSGRECTKDRERDRHLPQGCAPRCAIRRLQTRKPAKRPDLVVCLRLVDQHIRFGYPLGRIGRRRVWRRGNRQAIGIFGRRIRAGHIYHGAAPENDKISADIISARP